MTSDCIFWLHIVLSKYYYVKIYSFIHSLHSLPCDNFIDSSKESLPQSKTYSLLIQVPVSSLFFYVIQ
jgi:hypothetical protein